MKDLISIDEATILWLDYKKELDSLKLRLAATALIRFSPDMDFNVMDVAGFIESQLNPTVMKDVSSTVLVRNGYAITPLNELSLLAIIAAFSTPSSGNESLV